MPTDHSQSLPRRPHRERSVPRAISAPMPWWIRLRRFAMLMGQSDSAFVRAAVEARIAEIETAVDDG